MNRSVTRASDQTTPTKTKSKQVSAPADRRLHAVREKAVADDAVRTAAQSKFHSLNNHRPTLQHAFLPDNPYYQVRFYGQSSGF